MLSTYNFPRVYSGIKRDNTYQRNESVLRQRVKTVPLARVLPEINAVDAIHEIQNGAESIDRGDAPVIGRRSFPVPGNPKRFTLPRLLLHKLRQRFSIPLQHRATPVPASRHEQAVCT